MVNLIIAAAVVAVIAALVCFVTADAENAERAAIRKQIGRVEDYANTARAERNRDAFDRLGRTR